MDPLTIAYLAIMAAGTGAQYMGAKKVDSERAKALMEERNRRSKLTKENEATAEQSKKLFANVQKDQAARAGELGQQLNEPLSKATAVPGDARTLDPNAPAAATMTVGNQASSLPDVNARLAGRAAALGAAGSFGSVFGDYGRSLGHNAQDIDMNTTSMRNWADNVLAPRLEYANQSGRQWSTTGDVLKLVGTVMAPYALGGGAGNAAANTQTGVLDQMSGVPKAFAGQDLFGAADAGIGGAAGFGSTYGLETAADAGRYGGGFGGGIGGGMGGLFSSEEYSKALWKQLRGMALTPRDRQLLMQKQLQ